MSGATSPPPQRLVSLVPSLSETLWWWHLADRLVAVTDWCVAPPRAFPRARRIRGTKNPDVAAIIALAPDLVIADQEENREHDVRRLRDAGIEVHVTRVRSVTDAGHELVRLGEAVGRPDAGEGTRQALRRAVDQLRPPSRRLRAACPIWRDGSGRGADETWWVVGGDTFAGDLLARSGFDTVADGPDQRYPRMTLADLAVTDPDVVLLPDEPFAFAAPDAEVFATWRSRVRFIDGTALTWWGPRTPTALGDLSRLARQLARPSRGRAG